MAAPGWSPTNTPTPTAPPQAKGPADGLSLPGNDPYGNIVDYTVPANLANILSLTNQNCDWIEGAFEETFSLPTLNVTRWDPSSLSGTDHCVGLPPAGPQFCTAMLPSQFNLGAQLPGYTTSSGAPAYGAQLTLSQKPCTIGSPACVWNSTSGAQAYWAGAHLVSNGCVQYGVLEMEAKFAMPPTGGAFFFLATYIVKGTVDPSWNEIDLGFINGPRGGPTWTSATDASTLVQPPQYTDNGAAGLEFHATLFTAAPTSPTNTTMDALIYDATGPANGIGGTPKRSDGSAQTGLTNPSATFTTGFAANWHTYKIVWAKNWMAWMVDTAVYRNVTFAPWRPQSIRLILRTNIGTPASTTPLPDSNVYIRRIRYTPLSAQAVSDAINYRSMAAKYGDMPLQSPVYAVGVAGASAISVSGTGRRLSSFASTSTGPALNAALVAVVPGITSDSVNVETVGYALQTTLKVSNLPRFSSAVQAAMMQGLASDLSDPSTDNINFISVTPAGAGNWTVTVSIDGYATVDSATSDLNNILTPSNLPNTIAAMYGAEINNNYSAAFTASGLDALSFAALSNAAGTYLQIPTMPSLSVSSTSAYTLFGITVLSDASTLYQMETKISNAIATGSLATQLASPASRRMLQASNIAMVQPTSSQSIRHARRIAARPPPVDRRLTTSPAAKKSPPPPAKKAPKKPVHG